MFTFSVLFVITSFISYSDCSETGNNVEYLKDSLTNTGNSIKTECACILRLFANATQQFNWCVVKHAKPLRMCEKCAAQYNRLLDRGPVKLVKFNSSCVDDLIRSERFQVVVKVYDFQTGLWESAHCAKCYESPWNLTYYTKEFFHKLNKVTSCFKNYTTIHPPVNISSHALCNGCKPHYLSLKRTYDKILEETTKHREEDQLCVDIMSLMNDTRLTWTRYKCNETREKNYNVLSLSCCFGFLTFIYYMAMRKHEKYKNKIQTRSQRAKQVVNYDSE